MLGRPEICVPVFMKVCAGSWLICCVVIDRTMQISSAMLPMCGSALEIDWPDLPYFSKPCCGPRHFSALFPCNCAIGWPSVIDFGIPLPFISASFGL